VKVSFAGDAGPTPLGTILPTNEGEGVYSIQIDNCFVNGEILVGSYVIDSRENHPWYSAVGWMTGGGSESERIELHTGVFGRSFGFEWLGRRFYGHVDFLADFEYDPNVAEETE
jgi:hypothetical protein